jgi:hypothetical protein
VAVARALPDTFWQQVLKTDTCWLWTGTPNDQGYGRLTVDGVRQLVHRLSYIAHVGPIPDGLVIDHKCWQRLCVNPAHLQAVTKQANSENWAGSRKGSRFGVRGVTWHARDRRYAVEVCVKGQRFRSSHKTLAGAQRIAIEARNRLMTNNLADRRVAA